MRLDEYKKQQEKSLADFKQLIKTDRAQAEAVARRRLRSAGLLDEHGKPIAQ